MKKILLLTMLMLLIVGVAVFFSIKNKPETIKPQQPIPITTISPVSAPRKIDFSSSTRVAFSYAGPPTSLPDRLPTYLASYPTTLVASAASLAAQWKFTSPLKKPVPYVYDWVENERLFSYNDQTKSVSFAFFSFNGNASPNLTLTQQDVFLTLSSARFFSEFFSFVETDRQVASEEAEGGENNLPPIVITSYQYKMKSLPYPFFFTGVTRTAGEMRTTQDGKIVSFSFRVSPNLQTEQERQTLTTQQILEELNKQKGYLAGLKNDSPVYEPDPVASYSEVTISGISVAYLFIPEESRFVPIYVIEGLGYGTKTQQVRYFLRASS